MNTQSEALSYCGMPFSEYSRKYLGIENIKKVLGYIQKCKHEQPCTICCFPYEGPTRGMEAIDRAHNNNTIYLSYALIKFQVYKSPKRHFSIQHYIGSVCIGDISEIKLRQKCKNIRCANIWHYLVWASFIRGSVWDYITVCEHGRLCMHCCWRWTGGYYNPRNSVTYVPHIGVKSSICLDTRRHILETYMKMRFPERVYITPGCENKECVNPYHAKCTSKKDFLHNVLSMGRAVRLGRKQTSAKTFIAA